MKEDSPKTVEMIEGPNQFTCYSNLATVSFLPEEVVLHFGQRTYEDPNKANGVAKVYLAVPHAKRLIAAMTSSLKHYEEAFGEVISDPDKRMKPEFAKRIMEKTEGPVDE